MSVRRSLALLGLLSQALIAGLALAAAANWIDRTGATSGAHGITGPVAEPETWMLMLVGLGLALTAGLHRR